VNRTHEKLLVATLAGLVIAAAAAFAVSPAMAAGYHVDAPAQVTGIKSWDVLNVRKWPAPYSRKVGAFENRDYVWVERCIVNKTGGSDWCLVEAAGQRGWVNSRYLEIDDFEDI
jgi:uncharacterized protein YraI